MAEINKILNGEAGFSVRDKLNEVIDKVNASAVVVPVGDAPVFDPAKAGGYQAGSIISYRNEASPDTQFQTFAIYVANSDIPVGVSPEDSAEWLFKGDEYTIEGGNTSKNYVNTITALRSVSDMKNGDTMIVGFESRIYEFVESSESGIKPFQAGVGSWMARNRVSLSNISRIYTSLDALENEGIALPVGNVVISFADSCVFTITDGNGDAQLPVSLSAPSIVTKVGAGLLASDIDIEPIGGGGGHTILDPAGNTMPTQPALQFGDGFTVTDEDGKTVVERDAIDFADITPDPAKGKKLAKVKDDGTGLDYTDYGYDEVVQKAQTFNEGTLKKFDVNGNDVDSGLTGESLDIYAISPSLISALTNESNWRDGGGNPIVGGVSFASGIKGQRYYSDEYFYECIADDSWVRTYTGRPVINIYDNPALTLVFKGYLEDTLNWVGKIYVGTAITGVAQGTRHYDNDYVYEFFQTNVPIRYSRD